MLYGKCFSIITLTLKKPGNSCDFTILIANLPRTKILFTVLSKKYLFREAIHYVVKHFRADHVDVRISAASGGMHIDIADNGKGFKKATIEYGDRLNNYCNRAEKGGSTVNISSILSRCMLLG
jgi:signal transduction histidine kinase